jgi:glyoxylase-like metal-dependent hydrolase (beta-lactamase superfamily II)
MEFGMSGIEIGLFGITRVVELEHPMAPARSFFPDLTPEMLSEARQVVGAGNLTDDDKIILSFHSYILRTGRYNILVDTCCGNEKNRPHRPALSNLNTNYLDTLAAAGMKPEDVDFVMCTHLHWDHVGWNTRLVNGEWVPTFPNAKYIMAKREYDHWDAMYASGADNMHRNGFEDSVLPIMRAEKAVLVADDHEVDTGIWLEPCHGHSPGHVVINLASGGQKGLLTGDIIHHRLQMRFPDLSTSADTDMDLARVNRKALIEKHAGAGTLLCAAHFPGQSVGRIEPEGDHFRFDGVY